MPKRSRRATIVWLVMIALLLGIAIVSGALAPEISLLALAAYTLVALAGLGFFNTPEVRSRLPQMPGRASETRTTRPKTRRTIQVSRAALTARDRASRQPGYAESFKLMDLGLITTAIGPQGMAMRRGAFTLDDRGLQPYVVLYADPSWSGERVTVRYEILDHAGELSFLREEEVLIRDGQNILLSSYQMPLGDKTEGRPGLWEMQVSVNDVPLGLHTFSMGPSLRERQRLIREEGGLLQNDSYAERQARLRETLVEERDDDSPVSLEELLRQRS